MITLINCEKSNNYTSAELSLPFVAGCVSVGNSHPGINVKDDGKETYLEVYL